jgi:hypothetical protein
MEPILTTQPNTMTHSKGLECHTDPLTALQQELHLGPETRVDDSLHFGVRGQTPVMVLLEDDAQMRVLIEMGSASRLTAGQWAELASAWSQQIDGAQAGKPLVLDDTLWLSMMVNTRDAAPVWLTRVQCFLAWGSQIKTTVMMPAAEMQ